MNLNASIEMDAPRTAAVALELVDQLQQRLRVASLRIAIEGEDVTAELLETLESLAAIAEQKLT